MGIAGSIVDPGFLEGHLGLRVEPIDMTEIVRRVEEEIYDKDELARASAWVKAHCKEGRDYQRPRLRAQPRPEGRGLADVDPDGPDRPRPDGGQPPAREGRVRRGGARPQRDPRGLPGPAPLDRPLPQRRLHGGDPQLVLRLERHPGGLHLRHRERLPERRRDAVRPPAHGHRADLRRRPDLLEPGRGEARDRARPPGPRRGRDHPPHQLGGGRARRHRAPDRERQAGDEAVLGDHARRRSRPVSRRRPGTPRSPSTSAGAGSPRSFSLSAGCP